MIRVNIFYPREDGVAFDMDYYLNKHIPMVRELLAGQCKGISVEVGVAGAMPRTPPAYVAMAHLLFDSVEAYQAAMKPHVGAIMADIKNYTAIKPVLQVSEVKLT